jgi:natural product biosynthesis luciferase-like monooxygenase protein
MDFSLFYFGNDAGADGYRLLLEGARFADAEGLTAVWTPERHFGVFGGLFPNPAVTGAAVAVATQRIHVRAGSVVSPLHHVARIAEEWSVVDHLSGGRAGISLASGWHARDFALRPEAYERRKDEMVQAIDDLRRLWSGAKLAAVDGQGEPTELALHPKPASAYLPMWLTSGGSRGTFETAGRLGLGVLTHMLGQDFEKLRANIAAYRAAWQLHDRPGPHVVCMAHTCLGPDRELIRELIREPFIDYLAQSFSLLSDSSGTPDVSELTPNDVQYLIGQSFDRYFETSGLLGAVEDGVRAAEALADCGVDEIACLIDFGVKTDDVLHYLPNVLTVRDALKR